MCDLISWRRKADLTFSCNGWSWYSSFVVNVCIFVRPRGKVSGEYFRNCNLYFYLSKTISCLSFWMSKRTLMQLWQTDVKRQCLNLYQSHFPEWHGVSGANRKPIVVHSLFPLHCRSDFLTPGYLHFVYYVDLVLKKNPKAKHRGVSTFPVQGSVTRSYRKPRFNSRFS